MLSFKAPNKQPDLVLRPIRVGLLLCGDVHDALQLTFGNYAQCLIERLQLDSVKFEVRTWQAWQGELPNDVAEADAYLISGSPASVFDQAPWIQQLEAFIRRAHTAQRQLLGICFGHQMIHHALGGHVERAANWGLGAYPVHLHQQVSGLDDSGSVALYAMHRDQVVTPAEGFEHLAGNEFCPYYLMRHSDRVLTIQGHPEFTQAFFHAFLNISETKFDAKAVVQARREISSGNDSDRICQLLSDFLLRANTPRRGQCESSSIR